MEVKVLIFSILLLSALGLKITPRKVRQLISKTTTTAWRAEDLEVLETLVLLWNTALTASGCNQPKLMAANGARSARQPTVKQPDNQLPLVNAAEPGHEESGEAIPQEGRSKTSGSETKSVSKQDQPEKTLLPGRYLYGIGWGTATNFDLPGIDQAVVFGIQYREITAVVHACKCQPYQSEQRDLALAWIKQHQAVLDEMVPLFKCILPVGFDIIIDGTCSEDPDQTVRNWLATRYESILKLLRRLAGKREFGIQVMVTKAKLLSLARNSNPQIDKLERKIAVMTKGTAFLFQNELRQIIRETADRLRDEMKQSLKELIMPLTYEIKEANILGKQSNEQDELIADFAVLALPDEVEKIGTILEELQNRWGATVAYTGPWPPYNFVAELD